MPTRYSISAIVSGMLLLVARSHAASTIQVASGPFANVQWPTTLDLDYTFPVEVGFVSRSSWQSAPNGQLVGWDSTELVRVSSNDAIAARFPLVLDAVDNPRLIVQPDGKTLIIDSLFTKINGVKVPRPGFARLDVDGSL